MAMAVATVSNFPPAAWVSRTPPLPKLPKPPPSAPVDSLSSPLISQFTPKRITSSWYLTAVTVATASATATAAAVCLLPSGAASAAELAGALPFPAFELSEPSNALSLPTWAIHVSSVVEWVTAMALVWEYGDKSGFESWKGISWAMVPLLGGALCACTWHFFYNSESLEVLVALQAALTVLGNLTMCIAAYRTYKASQELPKKS